jgi:hypothetical protein
MFHEVSLRSLFDHLETHAQVQIECRVHAQDPQPQRQAGASRHCEELFDQLRSDSAPLMRGKNEDLRKANAVGLSFDDPNADRLAMSSIMHVVPFAMFADDRRRTSSSFHLPQVASVYSRIVSRVVV